MEPKDTPNHEPTDNELPDEETIADETPDNNPSDEGMSADDPSGNGIKAFFQAFIGSIREDGPIHAARRYPIPFIICGVLLLSVITAVVAFAVGSSVPPQDAGGMPSASPQVTATPSPVVQTPSPSPSAPWMPADVLYPNPLTGLEMGTDAYMETRPIALMHNNIKAAMPLLGVSSADILYEVPVEGGITRIMGLYQNIDDVSMLGTIRSARTVYLELALSHDAILVHCGASSMANKEMKSWEVDHIDAMVSSSKYFWRDADRKQAGYSLEHTLVSTGKRVREVFNDQSRTGQKENTINVMPPFTDSSQAADGVKAEDISVSFNSTKTTGFRYDSETKTYAVSQYKAEMKDGAPDGKVVTVSNLIVIQTEMYDIGDKAGHMSIDMQSGGSGYYAAEGKAIPIQWSRDGLYGPLVYTKEDGTPLSIVPGRTYVCVVSEGRTPKWES